VEQPKVSIIVPVYNVEKYIEKSLRSALDQTLIDIEIICVNDGIRDDSWQIVKRMAERDARIQLIDYGENRGQGYARNRGIEAAKGKYIMFLDADDFLEKEAAQVLYYEAEQNSYDIVFCGFNYAYASEDLRFKYPGVEDDLSPFVGHTYSGIEFWQECERTQWPVIACWSGIYLKDFLQRENLYFPEGFIHEDVLFVNECLLLAKKMCIVNQRLYTYYRRHQSTTTRDDFLASSQAFLIITCMLIVFFMKHDFPSDFYSYIGQRITGYAARSYGYYWKSGTDKPLENYSFADAYYQKIFSIFCQWQRGGLKITPELESKLKKSEYVIVYGAGEVGRRAIQCLARLHIDRFTVAVSKVEDETWLGGCAVRSIYEVECDRKKAIVLLAVGQRLQPEIRSFLTDLGYTHIVALV